MFPTRIFVIEVLCLHNKPGIWKAEEHLLDTIWRGINIYDEINILKGIGFQTKTRQEGVGNYLSVSAILEIVPECQSANNGNLGIGIFRDVFQDDDNVRSGAV